MRWFLSEWHETCKYLTNKNILTSLHFPNKLSTEAAVHRYFTKELFWKSTAQVLSTVSSELCEIIQNSYFEHPWVTASAKDAVLATIRYLVKLYLRIYEPKKRRIQNPVNPTKTPRVFQIETTWKRPFPPFPRRLNLEYTWCVCRESSKIKISMKIALAIFERSSIM